MSFSLTLLAPAVALGLTAGQPQTVEQQHKDIADAVTALPTCQQLGYSVDREGLIDWSEAVRAQAVVEGMTAEEAESALLTEVREEYGRLLERHSRALVMQHADENLGRNNRLWQKRCDRLAKDPIAGAYFSKS